jgi:serine/threonine protein kinase
LSSEPSDVQTGDVLASKYRVERVLGRGGMGVVVAARHEQLGFPVALKFMLPTAIADVTMKERFLREAQAAGRLRGEHVARVMDFGTLDDGAPYIVMEFLDGLDLHDVLVRDGALPPHTAVQYVLQACKAMEEAHAQGIVHRDLKPQNLFLTSRPDGSPLVKVLDFGISKLGKIEGQSLSVTSSSTMMGSPLYMAPEQIRSAKNVDARADIYSLGVVLFELMAGHVPIEATTIGELFEHIFTRATPTLRSKRPEISPELEAVVMRCLDKSPENRFASAAELAVALGPFIDARASLHGGPLPVGTAPSDVRAAGSTGPTTTLGSAAAVSAARWSAPPSRGARLAVVAGSIGLLVAGAAVATFVARGRMMPATTTTATAPSVAVAAAALPPPAESVVVLPAMASASASSAPTLPSASAVAVAPASPGPGSRSTRSATSSTASARPPATKPSSKPSSADPFGSPD